MRLNANVVINEDLTVPFSVLIFLASILHTFKRIKEQARMEAFNDAHVSAVFPEEPEKNLSYKIALIKAARGLPGYDYSLRDGKNIVEFIFDNLSTIERVAEVIF